MDPFILMIIAICVALAFDVMNGSNDTANAVATVIYTKALPPYVAIGIAAIMNMLGPFILSTAVANAIATGIIPQHLLTIDIIVASLMGAHRSGIYSRGLMACLSAPPTRLSAAW